MSNAILTQQAPHAAGVGETAFGSSPPTTTVLGLSFARLDFRETVEHVAALVDRGEPEFFITANVNYAMLCKQNSMLREATQHAAFVSADGMPIVWLSRKREASLPERVPGSDLLPALCGLAAERGYRVFFLGAAEGVGREAAKRLQQLHPGLKIAGVASPFLDDLTTEEEVALCRGIRESGADIVFAAFGQPKGEIWLSKNYHRFGGAVSAQVGASIDFAAGRVQRAPRWTHAIGAEWVYRLCLEPRRMASRYAANAWFLLTHVFADLIRARASSK